IAYSAWPDRIYVVDVAGRVAYKGAPGPWGFRTAEAAAMIERLLVPSSDRGSDQGAEPTRRQPVGQPAGPVGGQVDHGLRAFRGPGFFYASNRRAPSEADHVVEAWQ